MSLPVSIAAHAFNASLMERLQGVGWVFSPRRAPANSPKTGSSKFRHPHPPPISFSPEVLYADSLSRPRGLWDHKNLYSGGQSLKIISCQDIFWIYIGFAVDWWVRDPHTSDDSRISVSSSSCSLDEADRGSVVPRFPLAILSLGEVTEFLSFGQNTQIWEKG